ncbi:MAG: hypothetical protein GX799_10045 [Crenarchaeota archaeon]|nr:hypothetical protein [Thermoproteota archaeon]
MKKQDKPKPIDTKNTPINAKAPTHDLYVTYGLMEKNKVHAPVDEYSYGYERSVMFGKAKTQ